VLVILIGYRKHDGAYHFEGTRFVVLPPIRRRSSIKETGIILPPWFSTQIKHFVFPSVPSIKESKFACVWVAVARLCPTGWKAHGYDAVCDIRQVQIIPILNKSALLQTDAATSEGTAAYTAAFVGAARIS
jgi:hypothetical protein